jgi:hypothetical protein
MQFLIDYWIKIYWIPGRDMTPVEIEMQPKSFSLVLRRHCLKCKNISLPFDGSFQVDSSNTPKLLVFWYHNIHNHFFGVSKDFWIAELGYGFFYNNTSVPISIRRKPSHYFSPSGLNYPRYVKFGPRTRSFVEKRLSTVPWNELPSFVTKPKLSVTKSSFIHRLFNQLKIKHI